MDSISHGVLLPIVNRSRSRPFSNFPVVDTAPKGMSSIPGQLFFLESQKIILMTQL